MLERGKDYIIKDRNHLIPGVNEAVVVFSKTLPEPTKDTLLDLVDGGYIFGGTVTELAPTPNGHRAYRVRVYID